MPICTIVLVVVFVRLTVFVNISVRLYLTPAKKKRCQLQA